MKVGMMPRRLLCDLFREKTIEFDFALLPENLISTLNVTFNICMQYQYGGE